ncbi:unnamed protein product [Pleuronectes platessa]|uniref:Uncharacterized protein n=1 Tax=Pleuronectes platessa TaxID=8262 RepID=A0A9N7VVS4_PLEPL|nr:unnamed protein product [Pleuronectes platessa]
MSRWVGRQGTGGCQVHSEQLCPMQEMDDMVDEDQWKGWMGKKMDGVGSGNRNAPSSQNFDSEDRRNLTTPDFKIQDGPSPPVSFRLQLALSPPSPIPPSGSRPPTQLLKPADKAAAVWAPHDYRRRMAGIAKEPLPYHVHHHFQSWDKKTGAFLPK